MAAAVDHEKRRGRKADDRAAVKAGDTFGHWTAETFVPGRPPKWECRCRCGTVRKVSQYNLLYGTSTSCGCHRLELNSARLRAQNTGCADFPEYVIWNGAKQRCPNPKHRQYKDYGGRGISMCKEWRDDFWAFIKAVGRRPAPEYTLDRLDNDRGYELGNVAWRTRHDQVRNRRNTRLITAFGRTQTPTDWAEETGLTISMIVRRIAAGMSPEDALTKPGYAGFRKSWAGATTTEERAELRRRHPTAKKVRAPDGLIWPSAVLAAEACGLTKDQVAQYCRERRYGWSYLADVEQVAGSGGAA